MNAMRFLIVLVGVFHLSACASPVTPISQPTPTSENHLDVEMESAFTQARNTLDNFIERIETPHPARTFVAVKVRFSPPGDSVYEVWVQDIVYADGLFTGVIGDDIPSLRLEAGEEIEISNEDILDWMIVEDGKLIGGFTIRLAYQRMTPEEKAQFLELIDYSIDE